MPGVLAVGDARHGSVKRVASAVGAGSIAIRVLHRLLEADAAAPVEAGRAQPRVGRARIADETRSAVKRRGVGPSGCGRRSESRIISSICSRAAAPSGWSSSSRLPEGSRMYSCASPPGAPRSRSRSSCGRGSRAPARARTPRRRRQPRTRNARTSGGIVRPLEHVHLERAGAEPLDREAEVGRRERLETEDVDVEAHRLVEVVRDDAHVVQADGSATRILSGREPGRDVPRGVRRGQRLAGRRLDQPVPADRLPGRKTRSARNAPASRPADEPPATRSSVAWSCEATRLP